MADSSESGWRVVTEYETNPLASESDDEKRAESRASKKLKLEQSKRVKKASRFSSWPSSIRVDPVLPSAHRAITSGTSSFSKPGVCFTCGQPGHWKHECPKARRQARADKISDHLVFSEYKTSKDHKVLRQKSADDKCIEQVEQGSTIGRLRNSLNQWDKASASAHIKAVLKEGYIIPFIALPDAFHLKNNRSSLDNCSFVSEEIKRLIDKGSISELDHKPTCVNPLTVAFSKQNKPRLVLDCRNLNPHLAQFKFKYEDVSVAKQIFQRGDFLFTLF